MNQFPLAAVLVLSTVIQFPVRSYNIRSTSESLSSCPKDSDYRFQANGASLELWVRFEDNRDSFEVNRRKEESRA